MSALDARRVKVEHLGKLDVFLFVGVSSYDWNREASAIQRVAFDVEHLPVDAVRVPDKILAFLRGLVTAAQQHRNQDQEFSHSQGIAHG